MRIYSFGDAAKPTLLLLPGTCCHWKGNFGGVLPLLEPNLHVLCVSYDGFDETEPETTFPTMLDETRKIEDYVNTHCGGHLHAAYGCSLGGSFVGLLAARQRIRLDIGILGSSDMDQAAPWKAKLMTDIAMPLLYPLIRDGKFKWKFLNDRIEKRMQEMPAYTKAFLEMMGGARPYVSQQSCRNQFYSDMVTPLPDHWDGPTAIHVILRPENGAAVPCPVSAALCTSGAPRTRSAARRTAGLLPGTVGGIGPGNLSVRTEIRNEKSTRSAGKIPSRTGAFVLL